MEVIKVLVDDQFNLVITISIWLILLVLLVLLILRCFLKWSRFQLVSLDVQLGNVGRARFRPNGTDLQVAHKIWTELVTRKAAVPIDVENDVIEEIYSSWYALFQKVREYISEVPAELIRKEESTKEIVRIATQTINYGLRPHLTKWQARFRAWSEQNRSDNDSLSPQERQRNFPGYDELMSDLLDVNRKLLQYAGELKKTD